MRNLILIAAVVLVGACNQGDPKTFTANADQMERILKSGGTVASVDNIKECRGSVDGSVYAVVATLADSSHLTLKMSVERRSRDTLALVVHHVEYSGYGTMSDYSGMELTLNINSQDGYGKWERRYGTVGIVSLSLCYLHEVGLDLVGGVKKEGKNSPRLPSTITLQSSAEEESEPGFHVVSPMTLYRGSRVKIEGYGADTMPLAYIPADLRTGDTLDLKVTVEIGGLPEREPDTFMVRAPVGVLQDRQVLMTLWIDDHCVPVLEVDINGVDVQSLQTEPWRECVEKRE